MKVNGISRNCIARLNANGSLDTSFNSGTGVDGLFVASMALQPDRRLLIGDWFASVNGFARNYVARLFWGDRVVFVSGPVKDNGDFVARFKGTPGLIYTIESSASVSSAAWQKLTNRTAPTTDLGLGVGVFELRDAIAPSGQRFYRAVFPAY
ncbi:MAG TPA: delta-60 repeat domain-containing protein [Candidatus Eisenbacteria bacterium]|nr:delta-60 repeat domain-containing protein [Candidatus Eisenbacteria bacterium]